jgi:protein TonB
MAVNYALRYRLVPVALAMAVALGACKKDEPAANTAAPGSAQQQAPAPTPESVVASTVVALTPDQLRDAASKAYDENRLYAPSANNAMEYYLALRDKQPADAGASSALTDLMPMAVIATEQAIAREDFAEAKRLAALIGKADGQHPALARLKSSIAGSETAAASRIAQQQLTAEQEAKRQADLLKQREEDQRKQQELARQQVPAPAQTPAQTAAPDAAEQARVAEAERQRQAAAAEAERQRQQQAAAAAQAPAAQPARPAAAANELRLISQASPRFPPAAQRAGSNGSVVVEFTVNPDGSVGAVRAVSATGLRQYTRDFEREAVAAAKRWRFQPVGQATTTRRTIEFQN